MWSGQATGLTMDGVMGESQKKHIPIIQNYNTIVDVKL